MPTYEYECGECGCLFETFHGMLAEPLMNCPECHQPKLVKLIGMGACVIIKGTETPCHSNRGVSPKKPRTPKLGDKLGKGVNKTKKTPPWREGRPLDKTVLDDPMRYIRTGERVNGSKRETRNNGKIRNQ